MCIQQQAASASGVKRKNERSCAATEHQPRKAQRSGATTKNFAAEYAEHAEKPKTLPLMTQMRLISTDKANSKREENLREKEENPRLVLRSHSVAEPQPKTFAAEYAEHAEKPKPYQRSRKDGHMRLNN